MKLLEEKTEDQGMEKHLPVVEKTDAGIKVKVGSIPHPMETEHYIELIEVIAGDCIARKFLNPGEAPEAEFSGFDESVSAREHCTIHGLWKK
jgi:superoxide reductase